MVTNDNMGLEWRRHVNRRASVATVGGCALSVEDFRFFDSEHSG